MPSKSSKSSKSDKRDMPSKSRKSSKADMSSMSSMSSTRRARQGTRDRLLQHDTTLGSGTTIQNSQGTLTAIPTPPQEVTVTLSHPAQPAAPPRTVDRTVCPTFGDVVQLMRSYRHQQLVTAGALADRDQAQLLITKRLANAGHPLAGTVVVTSHQQRLLAFHGDITFANGLTIEFTNGGRLPMNRLVAVGIR